jgi:peptidoglycan/xylan/chitin deacetylase (PgdA/CDA1 family)
MRILKLAPALILAFVVLSASAGPIEQGAPALPSPDGTLRRLRVPILMYHYISGLPAGADQLRVGLTVDPSRFREHLDLLRSQGYRSVSLYEVYLALTHGYALPPNPIVLTFDDGYTDHIETVMPLLREYGFIGTFFIITGFADDLRSGYLTWPQVQQLAAGGMEVAAHSKSHPDLRGRDHDYLVYEVMGSLESIRVNVGSTMLAFAYPMGRYDDGTVDMLRQTGVTAAVTTKHGATHTTDGVLEMSRLRVQNTTGVPGLMALLREK